VFIWKQTLLCFKYLYNRIKRITYNFWKWANNS